jgi:hypothetical protein
MSNNIVHLIEIAIEPKAKGDQEKMGQALARLATEHPVDHESGQTIIKGTSEHHLEIIVDRMKRVQGRGQYRRATGRLSRDDHQSRGCRLREADRRNWFTFGV